MELLGILVDTQSGIFLLFSKQLQKVRKSAIAVQQESRRSARRVCLQQFSSFEGQLN